MNPGPIFFRGFLSLGWWSVLAHWYLRRRRYERAESVLRRMTCVKPSSFTAHFLLGRVGLATDRQALAFREFTVCHLLDPERLARQSLPASVVIDLFAESVRRRQVEGGRALDPANSSGLPASWSGTFGFSPWDVSADLDDGAGSVTDFVDEDEGRRFADLPPISPEDLVSVDMDALLTQLAESAPTEDGVDTHEDD